MFRKTTILRMYSWTSYTEFYETVLMSKFLYHFTTYAWI